MGGIKGGFDGGILFISNFLLNLRIDLTKIGEGSTKKCDSASGGDSKRKAF